MRVSGAGSIMRSAQEHWTYVGQRLTTAVHRNLGSVSSDAVEADLVKTLKAQAGIAKSLFSVAMH